MKKDFIMKVMAVSGLALATQLPHASALSYSQGNLFVEFQETGNSYDYVVNIGSVANLGSNFSINLGTDLANATNGFGSGWNNSNVLWSIFGATSTPASEDWASDTSSTPVWTNNGPQNLAVGTESTIGSNFAGGNNEVTGSATNSAFQTASTVGSYESLEPGGTDNSNGNYMAIGALSPNTGTQQLGLGAASNVLYLDALTVDTHRPPGTSTQVETFYLDSTGELTNYASVPESSTWASLFLAIGAVAILARKRQTQSAKA